VAGYNVLRQVQWRLSMTVFWCWEDGRITRKYSDAAVSSPGRLWSFRGWLANASTSFSPGMWIRYRQASFAQCAPLPGGSSLCGNKDYPWMRFLIHGNGTWHIDHA
jgi:hypothetical protein